MKQNSSLMNISIPQIALNKTPWLDWWRTNASNLTYHEEIEQQGVVTFNFSDYVRIESERNPAFLLALLSSNCLAKPFTPEAHAALKFIPEPEATEHQFMAQIRDFRKYHMLWIYWRDLTGIAELEETCEHISWLADYCIRTASAWAHNDTAKRFRIDSELLPLLVLGMGKYGAGELNVSSDIDLIYCFNDDQEKPSNLVSLEKFYTMIGRKVIQILDQRTAHGFVFRVDMRLRPYGDSGALVMSQSAMESYYLEQGRDWERFALIKARIVTGTKQQKANLTAILKPFVFRRYVDFSVLESPRQMKRLIESEIRRKNLGNNIKLGAGGIREVEFIAQALQLIHGGKVVELQCRELLKALPLISKAELLDSEIVSKLLTGYKFLRLMEHRLQAFKDQQTQSLPEESERLTLLAYSMGYSDWESCNQDLESTRRFIHQVFSDLFSSPEHEVQNDQDIIYQDIWNAAEGTRSFVELLERARLPMPEQFEQVLVQFRSVAAIKNMGPRGYKVLDNLMPKILQRLANRNSPVIVLERVIKLISEIIRRTAYLDLLAENQGALDQLLSLCSRSAMIADHLADYPYVLDELLTPETLFNPPSRSSYADALRQRLCRIPAEDIEARMDALREFRQTHLLRLSAADTADVLDVDSLSESLSELAEVILIEASQMAWEQLTERHGMPDKCRTSEEQITPGFCCIGYGKLGGRELSYSSDLDLVFIHDADDGRTDGDKPLDNKTFYLRLAQKIIHLLNIRTRTGVLYEVDMRLRPSGNSGLLVSHIDAFSEYQLTQAWVWEHQAIIRARFIFGSQSIHDKFAALRERVICQHTDANELALEVVKMRQRMRDHLLPSLQPNEVSLKQSEGGLADIEFLVQFWVLVFASEKKQLLVATKTTTLLKKLASIEQLKSIPLTTLAEHYLWLRDKINQQSLQKQSSNYQLEASENVNFELVKRLWSETFDGTNDPS